MSALIFVRFCFLLHSSPISSASLASASLPPGYALLSLLAPAILLSIHDIILNSVSQTPVPYHTSGKLITMIFFGSSKLILRPYQQRTQERKRHGELLSIPPPSVTKEFGRRTVNKRTREYKV